MTQFEAALARMQSLAMRENVRAGLRARPTFEPERHVSGTGRKPDSAVQERLERVREMSQAGMARRAIAEMLGIDMKRVNADIQRLRSMRRRDGAL
jgi:hypothetical protein